MAMIFLVVVAIIVIIVLSAMGYKTVGANSPLNDILKWNKITINYC